MNATRTISSALALVAVALGVRAVTQGLLGGALYGIGMIYLGREDWTWLAVFLLLAGGTMLTGAGTYALDRMGGIRETASSARVLAAVLLLTLVGANYIRHTTDHGMLTWDFLGERAPGHFPFEAGSIVEEKRDGFRGVATIGDDGFRICDPSVSSGERRVSLYGDSFVFGKGIPDDETLCFLLSRHYATHAPGRFQFHNRGQPGANIHSYVDNLAYAEDHWKSDLAVVGLLIPNDDQLTDLNDQKRLARSTPVRIASAVVGPDLVFSSLYAFAKVGRAEFLGYVSLMQGLDALAAETASRELPTLVFLWDDRYDNHAHAGWLSGWDRTLTQLAAAHPHLTYIGVMSHEEPAGAEPFHIPRDGHPTKAGLVDLLPQFAAAIEAAP